MESNGNIAIGSFEEMLDRYIGCEGSPQRTEFDREMKDALDTYYMGQSIKEAREAKNLTQAQLGELVGVKKSQISRWEHGRSITGSTLRKVFQAMDMRISLHTPVGVYPIA